MAIRGSLKEVSLPDVLQLLSMGQKTGCLSVADRSSFGTVYFSRGRISYASIVNRRDRAEHERRAGFRLEEASLFGGRRASRG